MGLAICDIVIASTGAPHFVIEEAQVKRALAARKFRNLFLIDLATLSDLPKVVAFLGVGALMLVIGYFAPLPPGAANERT